MLSETATATLDWLCVLVFAIFGALAASRKQIDLVGLALLGIVTGIHGGTLRGCGSVRGPFHHEAGMLTGRVRLPVRA